MRCTIACVVASNHPTRRCVVAGKSPYEPTTRKKYTPMALILTDRAAKELKRLIAQRGLPASAVVRVGVAGGGCSGFEYRMDLAEQPVEGEDLVSESHEVRVAMDRRSARFLDGTQIDFQEDLLKRGFVFNNPLAVKTCGCGSSFQV